MGGRRRISGQSGLTLVEILVGLVLIAGLAVVIVPQLISRLTQGETASLLTTMSNVVDATQAFRSDVGRYPRRIGLLTSPLGSGDKDSCGNNIPDVSAWRGPYLQRAAPASGLVTPGGVVADTLRRDPPTMSSGSYGVLYIDARGVDQAVAAAIQAEVDADNDFAAGSIRWTATGAGQGTLSFGVPVRGC